MSMVLILKESVTGALLSVLQIAAFVIPILLFIEILRDINILDRFSSFCSPLVRIFQMPKEACLPLLAGLIFGIAYGAGVIIQSVREGHLSLRDIYIINTFLIICHSIIEDTILFVAIGANIWLILFPRIIGAVVVCYIISHIYKPVEVSVVPIPGQTQSSDRPASTNWENRST